MKKLIAWLRGLDWPVICAVLFYCAVPAPIFGLILFTVLSEILEAEHSRYAFIPRSFGRPDDTAYTVIYAERQNALIPHSDNIEAVCIEFEEPLYQLPPGFVVLPDKDELWDMRVKVRWMDECIPSTEIPLFKLLETRSSKSGIYGSTSLFYHSPTKRAFYLVVN